MEVLKLGNLKFIFLNYYNGLGRLCLSLGKVSGEFATFDKIFWEILYKLSYIGPYNIKSLESKENNYGIWTLGPLYPEELDKINRSIIFF
jgi:hypothetical protein